MSEDLERTPFAVLCLTLGWDSPALFMRVYATTAQRLGEPPQLADRQVRRWRSPNPPCPQPGRQRVLEAMLGVPLEQVGFPVPAHRRHPVTDVVPLIDDTRSDSLATDEQDWDPVNRRQFLTAGGAALTGILPTDQQNGGQHHACERTMGKGGPHLGADAVADLRDGLASLYGLDDRFGGATVGPLADAHLARINRLITTGRYHETIGRQLRLIGGETAEHVGWLAFDAGDHQRASTYFGQALRRAEELRDNSLAVLVLASMTLLSLRQGEPHNGLNHVRRAHEQAKAWASPSLLSILATREARALALLGDATAARTTLARAARLYEQDQGCQPAPSWTAFHGPAEIAMAQAQLFTAAGHHGAAVTWLRRCLEHQERSYARNEALHRGDLASSLVRAGELEEAAYQIDMAQDLLAEVSSGRAREAVADARRELTSHTQRTP